jgi:hypothetical protein
MAKLSELDPVLIEIISERAEKLWQKTYPDALALFDTSPTVNLVKTEIMLSGGFPDFVVNDFTATTLLRCLSETFVKLLKRGALDAYQRLEPTSEAKAQIDQMAGLAPASVDPEVEARNTHKALADECVGDYKGGMAQSDFKKKWLGPDPMRRAVFQQIANSGRI